MAFLRAKREFVEKCTYTFLRTCQSYVQILITTESLLELKVFIDLIDILGTYCLIATITNSDAFIFQTGKSLSDSLQLVRLHVFCQVFGFLFLRLLHGAFQVVCAYLGILVTFFQLCQGFTLTALEASM